MKALRWYARKDLRYEEAPEPVPGRGQVKAGITLAGICGTDLREYISGPCMIDPARIPIILGHEFCGRVTEVGEGVTGFAVGDRVTGLGYWPCGECYYCQKMQYNICPDKGFSGLTENGCMAEYMVAPCCTYYKLPDSVSDEFGALVEPLSVALHALRQGNVRAGDSIAIVGDGTIGLCVLLLARAAGAKSVYVVFKHEVRGQKAKALGATEVIPLQSSNPVDHVNRLTAGLGVDVSFECVGNPDTAQLAVDLARRDGTAVIIGVFDRPGLFQFADVVFGEKRIVGSSIYVREAEAVINLLADKRIDPGMLITSKVPLKDAVKMGFEKLIQDKENNLKVLLQI